MVSSLDSTHAACTTWYEHGSGPSRPARIRLDRFKPNSTGYRRATPQECERQGIAGA